MSGTKVRVEYRHSFSTAARLVASYVEVRIARLALLAALALLLAVLAVLAVLVILAVHE